MTDIGDSTDDFTLDRDPAAALKRYWRTNVLYMVVLLLIWAVVGLGCGVLFADWLNQFRLPGTAVPLGFWFAQQGSIIVFVLLILVYCLLMNRLDRKHHARLQRLRRAGGRQRVFARPTGTRLLRGPRANAEQPLLAGFDRVLCGDAYARCALRTSGRWARLSAFLAPGIPCRRLSPGAGHDWRGSRI